MGILTRNPLAYPVGIAPGFDPKHIAAQGLVKGAGFSGVASHGGANVVSLLSGQAGTIGGTPSPVFDGHIGPAFKTTGSSDITSFSGNKAATETAATISCIITTPSSFASFSVLFWSSSSVGSGASLYLSGANPAIELENAGSNRSTAAFSLATSTPYFLAGSVSATRYSFVAVNLITGQQFTETGSASHIAAGTSSGTYQVGGNTGFGQPFGGPLAAAMYSPVEIALPQLTAWAQDPWSFWYPDDDRPLVGVASASFTLTAARGSFTETGEPVVFAETMPAAQGSFALTGEAAGLVQGTVLTSAQGSFALTGEAALFAESMPASQGSFTLTGEPATLSATSGSTLTAAFGSFTLTGEAAGLVQGTVFTAAQGAYVLTGEAALFAEVMTASFGSYVLTGEPATLSGTSSNSLTAAFGSFTLTGEGALFAEAMPAAQGSFALTGEAAGLVQGTVFTAAQGSFVLTGEPVTFTAGTSVLAAATGHYVLTGHAATLTATGAAAAPLPTMKPYQPRAYPQIAPGIPMWHTGQNNDISSSVASLIETIKTLDARLRTGGL